MFNTIIHYNYSNGYFVFRQNLKKKKLTVTIFFYLGWEQALKNCLYLLFVFFEGKFITTNLTITTLTYTIVICTTIMATNTTITITITSITTTITITVMTATNIPTIPTIITPNISITTS